MLFFPEMATTNNMDTTVEKSLSSKLLEKGQKSPFLVASMCIYSQGQNY